MIGSPVNNKTHKPSLSLLGVHTYPLHIQRTQSPINSEEKESLKEGMVIAEQQMECDSKNSQDWSPSYPKGHNQEERGEVNSVRIKVVPHQLDGHVSSSCIANNSAQQKALRRSLNEFPNRVITTLENETVTEDKMLYLELEKEKRMRKKLEQSYRQLLHSLHEGRSYSGELSNSRGHNSGRNSGRRTASKRTLKIEQGSIEGDEREATTKRQIGHSSDEVVPELKLEDINKQEEEIELPEGEEVSYVDMDDDEDMPLEFQERVLNSLETLNKRVTQLDEYLVERENQREREKLTEKIAEKDKQLRLLQQQNQQLRVNPRAAGRLGFVQNLSPSSLYFLCIMVLALVALT